jgi:hypothetical protein
LNVVRRRGAVVARERQGSGVGATVPARYSAAGTVHVGERDRKVAARVWGTPGSLREAE